MTPRRSLRIHLTLVVAGIMAAALLAAGTLAFLGLRGELHRALKARADDLARFAARVGRPDAQSVNAVELSRDVRTLVLADDEAVYAVIVDAHGRPLASFFRENAPALAGNAASLVRRNQPLAAIDAIKRTGRVLEATAPVVAGDRSIGTVALGLSRDRTSRALVLQAVILGGGFLLVAGLGIGVLRTVVRRSLGPVRALIDTASAMSAGNLDAAVAGTERTDELGVLARALAGMASRARALVSGLEGRLAELRAAGQALQESEARYRRIVETANEGIWVLDPDDMTTFVNARTTEMLGYRADEMVGRPFTDFMFEEDVPDHRARLAARRQRVSETYERRLRRQDGSTLWVSASASAIVGDDGRFGGSFGMMTDITERKRAEEAMRRLNRELRAVSRCNQALIRAGGERELLDEICRIICAEAGHRFAVVVYAEDDAARSVRPVAWAGVEEGFIAQADVSWADEERGRGLVGSTIREGVTTHVPDITTDPRTARWRERAQRSGYRSGVGMPLRDDDGRVFGALVIFSSEAGAFAEDEIRLLDELAGDLAYGVVVLRTRAERERAEAELRTSEEKFAAAFHASPNLIAITRASDGAILEVNEAYTRLLGYERAESVGKTTSELGIWVVPEDRRRFVRAVLRDGGIDDFETRLRRKDGTVVDCLDSGRTVEFAGERCVLSIVHDITDRKRMEEVLRRRETDLLEAQRVGRLGSWEWDAVTDTIVWSEEYCRLFGVDAAQRPPSYAEHLKVYTPESATVLDAAVRRNLRSGEPYEVDLELARPAGEMRWIAARSATVLDASGKIVGLRGTAQDITERKALELELRRSAAAIEQAAEAIVITDTAGTIQYVNPAFSRVSGYAREEAIGQNPRVLKSGQTAPEVYRSMWEALGRGEVWHGRFVNRRKDGALFEEDASISPVRDEDGTVRHYVAVKRDVTQEVALEGQLRQAQKMDAVGRLAGGIAHDFNNLLQAMLSHAQLLRRAPERVEAELAELEAEIQRGAALSRQLLLFSRQEAARREPLDLNGVLREVEPLLRRLVPENVEVVCETVPGALVVEADRGQLHQVLMNLAINAMQAMPDGGRVVIRSGTSDLGAWFAVEDTGCGIPEEIRERIFEPFFTTKAAGHGSGLGLSVAHGIITQHGGRIEVESAPGSGSTFRVALPLAACTAGEAVPRRASPEEVAAGRGQRVLVVEDEARLRATLAEIIGSLGYEVTAVGSAAEAGRLPTLPAFDLLLTDVMLPDVDGPTLAAGLRERWADVRVVLMSGYSPEDLIQRGAAEGAVELLEKPFSISTLARALSRALADR